MVPGSTVKRGDITTGQQQIVFGPVPSRRFGMSLGVNNIPRKKCSYSCVYCQVGRTDSMIVDRRGFFPTDLIEEKARKKLQYTDSDVDVITFVPDGEPTLDADLGKHIRALGDLEIDIAVITNSSLLWMEEVREDLLDADIVSVKVDSVDEGVWSKVNRPHGDLSLSSILDGIRKFSRTFNGRLWTETMLVNGLNDGKDMLERNASFLSELDAENHHITVPIRPPAEDWVKIPWEKDLALAYAIYSSQLENVTTVSMQEEGAFGSSGDIVSDILSTCAVHPMREDSVEELVSRSGGEMGDVEDLVNEGRLRVVEYRGTRFYLTSSG